MPSNLKKRVRKRMAETGESWATAQKAVREQTPTTTVSFVGSTDPSDPEFRGTVVRIEPNVTYAQGEIRTPLSSEDFARAMDQEMDGLKAQAQVEPLGRRSTEAQRLLRLDEIRPIKNAAIALVARLTGNDSCDGASIADGPLLTWNQATVTLSIASLEAPVQLFKQTCLRADAVRTKEPQPHACWLAALADGSYVPYVWNPKVVSLWKRATRRRSDAFEIALPPGQVNTWDRDGTRRILPLDLRELAKASFPLLEGDPTQEEIDAEYKADYAHDAKYWVPLFEKMEHDWKEACQAAADDVLRAYKDLAAAMDRALAE